MVTQVQRPVVLTFDHTKLADGLAQINDGNGKLILQQVDGACWICTIDEVSIL